METALPHPAELHIVSNHLKQHQMALVHLGVFEKMWDSCLFNMVRPPSRRNAGTRLRQPKPIATLASLFHYRTSILRGLAAHSLGEAIERRVWSSSHPQGSPLIPIKETAVRRTYKTKLMCQNGINNLCSFERFARARKWR